MRCGAGEQVKASLLFYGDILFALVAWCSGAFVRRFRGCCVFVLQLANRGVLFFYLLWSSDFYIYQSFLCFFFWLGGVSDLNGGILFLFTYIP